MDKTRLLNLLTKYQSNSCTEEEVQELEQWYSALNRGNQPIEITERFSTEMLKQFRNKLSATIPVIPFYRKKIFRIAAAAAVLLLVAGYWLFVNRGTANVNGESEIVANTDVIPPTTTRATLKLSDGRIIYLDSAGNGSLATQGNVNVVKLSDGQISYQSAVGSSQLAVQYNTISNGRGSKVQPLTLIDGSKVWLNAESSITFPTAFVGNERKISITGEAYFEVSKDESKRFIVESNGIATEVLGTHFNVNAYDDEADIKVTLLEGSVKVSKNGLTGLLKPGQQAQINSEIRLVENTDLEQVIAWKNGMFSFEKSDIKTIMRQIARWYDVDVVYEGAVKETFRLKTSRNTNVSNLFKILEETGGVHLEVKDKTIIVRP